LVIIYYNSRVRTEIQDSLIFKSDDKTLRHLDKLKESNKEIENIICWLEEYSGSGKSKEIYNNIRKKTEKVKNPEVIKKLIAESIKPAEYLLTEKSLCEYDSNYSTSKLYPYIPGMNDFNSITSIDSSDFNIFIFDQEVGKENTLSMVSCYIFLNQGLYSIIEYTHFENFLDLIVKGYNRKNSYHNDLHAADVEQTCYIYERYGNIKYVSILFNLESLT
jgi:hypothetical protein